MSFELSCTFKHESESAILIYDHATEEDIWFPLSQVEAIHGRTKEGRGQGTIVVSDWIAQKKGLI